ncbi:hypothetical protein MMC07_005917 [Pseudocyphellaria aurata]|nr:hypothetical protein [Pseudocyphellaria aurata]
MAELSDFQIGQTVALPDGRIARVHFIGITQFASGDWLGVELDDASGKNDGAVQGQRYFDCEPGHGMFVRPAVATILELSTPKPNGRANGGLIAGAPKSRPQSAIAAGLRRQSVMDQGTARRQSINTGSPTPATRGVTATRLGSPTKSPTKQLGSSSSSGHATPPGTTTSMSHRITTATSKTRRPSMAPPSLPSTNARASRQSVVGTMNGSTKASGQTTSSSSQAASNRLSIRSGEITKFGSVSGESQVSASSGQRSPAEGLDSNLLSPKAAESRDDQPGRVTTLTSSRESIPSLPGGPGKPTSIRSRTPPSTNQRGPPTSTALSREVEDLKTKLRILEKKRIEDREKLKNLEKLQTERDKFEGIIQKLQSKYQPQQQEISDLKKQLKEEAGRFKGLEAQQAESEALVEEATVDREMAEETAESLKLELDALRRKHEETELEVDVLREENLELGKEMSPEEKTSQGWLQMERSNERLREALMRLRDMTQLQEADLKAQVVELEKDVHDSMAVKEKYLETKEMLAQSEAAMEDLRDQLDTALGAEEMIEELTEKNFRLNEQLDGLRGAVEDLESLKEVSDEIELSHTENEKQLQSEVDHSKTVVAEQARNLVTRDKTINDLEYTVSRYRALVINMHSDLEDMRASQQITEKEANDLTSRSRVMMDLNMRLQVSASKTQVKAIDFDLRRLEAQEASEHLNIIQLFLPESFKTERNCVLGLLSIKRIGFKASMMHGFIKERVDAHVSGHEEEILICCDILDKLTWISNTCDRFDRSIRTSSLDAFRRLEAAVYELEPVERAFKGWIDGLRRNELKEEQCAMELQRSIALMTHLGEKHISKGLEQHADDIHMRAVMMQSHLENTAAALFQVKSMTQMKVAPSGEVDEDDHEMQDFLRKADSLIMQTRNAKVIASKAIRQLEELKSRYLTLDLSTLPIIEQFQDSASDLASSSRNVGHSLFSVLNEEGRTTPFTYQEIATKMSSSDTQPFSMLSSKIHATTTQMQNFHSLTSSLAQTVEFSLPPLPPWLVIAQKMHVATADSVTHDTEIRKLKDEMAAKNTALAIREKIVEEMSVKVEVLEKRVGESVGRRERVRELEGIADTAKEKEKSLLAHLTRQQQLLRDFEAEREAWKNSAPLQNRAPSDYPVGNNIPSTPDASSSHRIATLKSEISALQSSIRYLRSTSRTHHLSSSLDFLSAPLIPPAATPTPVRIIKSEAADVLKEFVHLVSRPENRLFALRSSNREDRLRWKPARESSVWVLGRQKGEWESWKGWARDVERRGNGLRRDDERKRLAQFKGLRVHGEVSARMEVQQELGKGGEMREVRIVQPGVWEEVERMMEKAEGV